MENIYSGIPLATKPWSATNLQTIKQWAVGEVCWGQKSTPATPRLKRTPESPAQPAPTHLVSDGESLPLFCLWNLTVDQGMWHPF